MLASCFPCFGCGNSKPCVPAARPDIAARADIESIPSRAQGRGLTSNTIPRQISLSDLDLALANIATRGQLPGGGEFLHMSRDAKAASSQNTASIVALLVWHGFLPMESHGSLLGKLHQKRCLVRTDGVHVGRKIRRAARQGGYKLTVDEAWDEVVAGVQKHTYTSRKGDCWLSNAIAEDYRAVRDLEPALRRGVLFHSMELRHEASGSLVAGEIGCTCGGIYTSLTAFALKDEHPSAGNVQLAAVGAWLRLSGFEYWDLGMDYEYKRSLGAAPVPRSEWVRRQRELRGEPRALVSPAGSQASAAGLLAVGGPD